jgi:hypothetical protein
MDWLKKTSRPALPVLGTANLAPRKPPSFSPHGRREPTQATVLVGSLAARSEDASFEEFQAKIRAGTSSGRERDSS